MVITVAPLTEISKLIKWLGCVFSDQLSQNVSRYISNMHMLLSLPAKFYMQKSSTGYEDQLEFYERRI